MCVLLCRPFMNMVPGVTVRPVRDPEDPENTKKKISVRIVYFTGGHLPNTSQKQER